MNWNLLLSNLVRIFGNVFNVEMSAAEGLSALEKIEPISSISESLEKANGKVSILENDLKQEQAETEKLKTDLQTANDKLEKMKVDLQTVTDAKADYEKSIDAKIKEMADEINVLKGKKVEVVAATSDKKEFEEKPKAGIPKIIVGAPGFSKL